MDSLTPAVQDTSEELHFGESVGVPAVEKKPFDADFPFKDDPALSETFADGIHQITVDQTTFRLTLTSSRGDLPKGNKTTMTGYKALAARIIMPTPAMAELYNQLDKIIRGLEAQGLVTRSAEGVKPTLQ